jgi:hypothetical protein
MAYLTTTILEQESSWFFTAWQPQIASSSTFDTWIGTIVTRVGNHTHWRVGDATYNTTNTLVQAVLQEAELCLAQYYLCLASAAIADTSDDVTTVPAVAHGNNLRQDANEYLLRYNEILAPYDTNLGQAHFALPVADTANLLPEAIPQFLSTVDWARPG